MIVGKRKTLADDVHAQQFAFAIAECFLVVLAAKVIPLRMLDCGPANLGQELGHGKQQVSVTASNLQTLAADSFTENRLGQGDNQRYSPDIRPKGPFRGGSEFRVRSFLA